MIAMFEVKGEQGLGFVYIPLFLRFLVSEFPSSPFRVRESYFCTYQSRLGSKNKNNLKDGLELEKLNISNSSII